MKDHRPLHRRRAGFTAYDCTCEWRSFEFTHEWKAWDSYREHHRGETADEPEETGREPGHPCGHWYRVQGCGGCDPGAIEIVIPLDPDEPWEWFT